MQHIDQKIGLLAALCGAEKNGGNATLADIGTERSGDAALLNGPQLATTAQSQDDIDRLFGS